MSDQMASCVDDCIKCYRKCEETLAYCLQQGGKHADPEHIKLMMECAEICRLSASSMMRGTTQSRAISTACAEVCRACAKSCDAFGDDEKMKECAATCFKCADSCESMSK
jgi:hypothetical protein